MTNNELCADWQARAEAGDGSFAIALALLNLTKPSNGSAPAMPRPRWVRLSSWR
jgi:hypothetical protein